MLALEKLPLSKTLIVSPLLSLSQWEENIRKLTSSASVLVFDDRCEVQDLTGFNFVITSHETVRRSVYKTLCCPHCHQLLRSLKPQHFCDTHKEIQGKKAKPIGPLHSIDWERIFLDEGHLLEGGDQAILSLKAKFRWVLTSRLDYDHLYPMLRFLQAKSLSLYFCQDCTCTCTDLGFWTKCPTCRHKSAEQHLHWLELRKIQNQDSRFAYLCRSKASLSLPPCYITVRLDPLTKPKTKLYEDLRSSIHGEFEAYLQGNFNAKLQACSRSDQSSKTGILQSK